MYGALGHTRIMGLGSVLCLAGCGPAVAVDNSDTTTTSQGTASATSLNTQSATLQSSSSVDVTTGSRPRGTTGFSTSDSPADTLVGDAGFGYITDPDGGPNETYCTVWEDDGWCPRGEACRPFANDGGRTWNANRCSPIADDPDLIGDPCVVEDSAVSGFDSCEARSMCLGVDPKSLQGTCVAYCDGTEGAPVCADPTTTCAVGNDGVVAVCLPSCDPMLQNCGKGEICTGNWGEPARFFCMLPSVPYFNAAGVQPAACDQGNVGVSPELVDGCLKGEPCCTSFCDPSLPDSCMDGLECTLWTAEGMCPGICDEAICLSPG
ncbi:MAG: hypothetical protein KUG77_17425 [Nannocystaceae bacterium]|nr:hypothetical protein [Nannocystaceae bacterium]